MDLDGRRGLRGAGHWARLVGHAPEPAADRRHGERAGDSAPRPPSSAMLVASRSSPPPRAPISPTPPGYAHAQDRFFQMDLSRRLAAGELSELFGERGAQTGPAHAALRLSRGGAPRHRSNARRTSARVVEAYARGVNAGLTAPRERAPGNTCCCAPQPREWLPEDSVLVVHSMWWQLQYGTLREEIDAAAPRTRRGRARRRRRSARRSSPSSMPAIPTGTRLTTPPTLRACRPHAPMPLGCSRSLSPRSCGSPAPPTNRADEPAAPGSNNWAVAGIHTRSGVALIANDMHLDLGVPAVWYPARLRVTGDDPGHHRGHPAGHARGRGRAPTARWPGDSPTATAISPMRAGASA